MRITKILNKYDIEPKTNLTGRPVEQKVQFLYFAPFFVLRAFSIQKKMEQYSP